MLEAEEAFIETTEQLASRIDDMLRNVTRTLLNTAEEDIYLASGTKKDISQNPFDWLDKPFPRLTYADAAKILEQNNDKLTQRFDASKGFNREQELFLVNYAQAPMFIIDWPKEIKPFYMRESQNNPNLVCFIPTQRFNCH